jgi:hypothetical protein
MTTATTAATKSNALALVLMGGLAMSYGWGFRGDYGHESGAMIPGALLAMGVAICSGREEWLRRCALLGLCGAIGWAFGGQQSYGQITSYTVSHSLPDVYYGYTCLFLVGMSWGGIGGAILSLALTLSRDELKEWTKPFLTLMGVWLGVWVLLWTQGAYAAYVHAAREAIQQLNPEATLPELSWLQQSWGRAMQNLSEKYLHDTDWPAATITLLVMVPYALLSKRGRAATTLFSLMAAGWWLGYLFFVQLLDLHMSPTFEPGDVRSDNWGGVLGLIFTLLAWLFYQKNRAGFMLALYGAMAGGIGFSVGDFINKPDKIQWEPWYQYEFVRGFDHWKWSEQSFGLMMGLGVSLGLLRLLRGNFAIPQENERISRIDYIGAFTCVVAIMWMTIRKNVPRWYEKDIDPQWSTLFGFPLWFWVFVIGMLLSGLVVMALRRYAKGDLPIAPSSMLGKAQILFFLTMWVSLLGVFIRSVPNFASRGMVFVHGSFWVTCIICTWFALRQSDRTLAWTSAPPADAQDPRWRLGIAHWVLWLAMPGLILALSVVTMAMHDQPQDGARLRFGPNAYQTTGEMGRDLNAKEQ